MYCTPITMVLKVTSLNDVKAEATPEKQAFWGTSNLWWTHRPEDLLKLPGHGIPCDPLCGVLLQGDLQNFLTAAQQNPSHYGKWGLDAFMFMHNDNCLYRTNRGEIIRYTASTWKDVNSILDRFHGGLSPRPLHYRTQEDQPMGSTSRKCSNCGVMIWPEMQLNETPWWTSKESWWSRVSFNCSNAKNPYGRTFQAK